MDPILHSGPESDTIGILTVAHDYGIRDRRVVNRMIKAFAVKLLNKISGLILRQRLHLFPRPGLLGDLSCRIELQTRIFVYGPVVLAAIAKLG